MPSVFASMTVDDLQRLLMVDFDGATYDINRMFLAGDHWQGGDGWVGPMPKPGEDGFEETLSLLEKGFVSKNVMSEVAERHMTGVVGNEPAWAFVPNRPMEPDEDPSPAEQSAIQEIEAALTPWTEKRKLHQMVQQGVVTLLAASRNTWRLMIPEGAVPETAVATPDLTGVETDDEGNPVAVAASDLVGALSVIWPESLQPDMAAIIEDADTKQEAAILLMRTQAGIQGELSYVENGLTIVHQIVDGQILGPVPMQLSGRLNYFEMRRSLLLTPQVQQQQKSLNLSLSCIPRTVITAGFLERILLNAQMPGHWERDQDGNPVEFIPAKYVTGAGATQFVQGIETGRDAQTGEVQVTNPSVVHREPTAPTHAIIARDATYRDMLEECDQGHVLMASAATPTGVSREQARGDYEKSLQITQVQVQDLFRWVLESALAVSEHILNAPGRWTSLFRATVDCRIDTGPVTADEERVVAESVEKGLMSEETGMTRLRIPDVDAEKARIMAQPGARLKLLERQTDLISKLTSAGFDLEAASELAGLGDEQMAIVKKFATEQEALLAEQQAQEAATGDNQGTDSPSQGNVAAASA